MTLPEVAEYFKVDKKTIYRMVKNKEIPAFKVRSEWRFKKPVIDDWIAQSNIVQSQTTDSNSRSFEIPIIGRIAAGVPILAEENIEGTITVDRNLVRNPDKVFALKVQGNSMINAGINDGDIILVREQSIAENGDLVAVLIDNEATVKRFYLEKGKVK
ncbi:MAG: transcriptional repressor LexA, partial [Planctomycetota bacterium]